MSLELFERIHGKGDASVDLAHDSLFAGGVDGFTEGPFSVESMSDGSGNRWALSVESEEYLPARAQTGQYPIGMMGLKVWGLGQVESHCRAGILLWHWSFTVIRPEVTRKTAVLSLTDVPHPSLARSRSSGVRPRERRSSSVKAAK
jgi:hypothetical protein